MADPLHKAAKAGDAAAIWRLVGAGADVNAPEPDFFGWTPLHYAAMNGHIDSIRALVHAGAAVNCVTKLRSTPLHLAACNGHANAIWALIGKGAGVNVVDEDGWTPLHVAVFKGQDNAIQALMNAGACLTCKNHAGRTPLELGNSHYREEAARALQEEAAVITPAPRQGRAAGTNISIPAYSVVRESSASPPAPASRLDSGLPSCEVAESEVVLVEKLGQGSFGEVWRGQWYGSDVAVKKLRAEAAGALHAEILASLRQESALMASLRHDRIVGLRGVCFDPPLIVMELCGRQALDAVLQEARCDPAAAQKLTWSRRLGILVDVAWGMTFLHSRNVLHRDLKSPNILVDDSWRAKVADFNLSKLMEIRVGSAAASSRARSTYSSINPRWLAPELVLEGEDGAHGHATPASDCFAFGLVLWEVLTWQYPWANLNENQIVGRLYQHRRPPIPDRSELPGPNSGSWVGLEQYISLMQRCWDDNPAARPSFSTVATELQALLG